MEKIDALSQVLQDPTRSARDKEIARTALNATQARATDSALNELLLIADKPLGQIGYHAIHQFCSERGWRNTRDVYEQWLRARFNTDSGRADLQRAAEYLRSHDLTELDAGLRDWKSSQFKSADRLIRALEVIATSPERGNYHDSPTVEECKQFLAEMRRRTAP